MGFNDIGIRSGDSHVIENLSNAHDLVTGNNELVRLNPNAAPFMSTIHHINVEANMFVPFAENSTSPPFHHANLNMDVNILNLCEKVPLWGYTPFNTTLNPYAKVFILFTIPTNPVFNPYAVTFVPLYNLSKRNCVILAILATLLFLIILLLIHLITTNSLDIDVVNSKDLLKKLKHDNPNKIIIGHLNINSSRYKFDFLKELIGNNIDIFLISETKLNDTFPFGQYLINGYHTPFRFDRNDNGGGLLLYFRDHIPCKKITLDFRPVLEVIVIEIKLKKEYGCLLAHIILRKL